MLLPERRVAAQARLRHPPVPGVVSEAPQDNPLVALPFGQSEGAGPDQIWGLEGVFRPAHDLLWHDGEQGDGVGHRAEKGALRLLQRDPYGERIDDADGLDGVHVAPAYTVLHEAVDGGLHVVGGHGLAVVELHAGPQLERVLQTIIADRPTLGELGNHAVVLADRHESFEDMGRDLP